MDDGRTISCEVSRKKKQQQKFALHTLQLHTDYTNRQIQSSCHPFMIYVKIVVFKL